MAVRTIACTECGTTVPYGRLSCPSCGELLASVTGAARRLTSLVEVGPEPAIEESVATDDAPDVVADAGDLGSLTWPTVPSDPVIGSGSDDAASEARSSVPVWTAPPFPPQPSITVAPPAETPGAYVPPAPVSAGATALAGDIIPAGLPAPARSWAGAANADPGAAGNARDGDARASAELSLTDPARRAEAIDWIAVAGAALGSVGFLLPWAGTIVGADGVGYLDTWGLAGPGHALVVVGMLAVLALAVARTRIPAWVRLGIPGLILSALLVGLLWPYLLGPLGPLPGAYLSLVGALVLGAAAVAALATDRHARTDPRV